MKVTFHVTMQLIKDYTITSEQEIHIPQGATEGEIDNLYDAAAEQAADEVWKVDLTILEPDATDKDLVNMEIRESDGTINRYWCE